MIINLQYDLKDGFNAVYDDTRGFEGLITTNSKGDWLVLRTDNSASKFPVMERFEYGYYLRQMGEIIETQRPDLIPKQL